MPSSPSIRRLREFVLQLDALLDQGLPEAEFLPLGEALLAQLVLHDDWLPPAYAVPSPLRYQQYLLYTDLRQRFSVVSFVWGPGQSTPIHNHTVWGLIGMLRGAEQAQAYARDDAGRWQPQGQAQQLLPGQVQAVSPTVGDVHRVSNALAGQSSISIHVYGANIGAVRRTVFLEDGSEKPFISGYSASTMPNLWDLSER